MELKVSVNDVTQCDVAVIGGGTAGCFAAIAAANAGAATVLIEKNGMLGGTMTAGGVNFPGLFFAWGKQIIGGPCWAAIERTMALAGAEMPAVRYAPANHWDEQILINRFIYTAVLDEFCAEAGVAIRLHTMLSHAEETEDGVTLFVTGKSGLQCVQAKVLIDATGDANAVTLLGYACAESAVLQPASLVHTLAGYDIHAIDKAALTAAVGQAVAEGRLPQDINAEYVHDGLARHKIRFHVPCAEAFSSAGKTQVELAARKKLCDILAVLQTMPGLGGIYADYAAAECGIRETKRIVGEKTMTEANYLAGTVYDDAIAYAFYPVDRHVMGGIVQTFLEPETVPTVPYGALIPKGAKRVLAAGRCAAADANTNSAVRVQAPCMAMGQAAGCAAALAAAGDMPVAAVDYTALCAALAAQGAIVPGQGK